MPLPEISSSIFNVCAALDSKEYVCVNMGCVERRGAGVSLILDLISPELAKHFDKAKDGVPEMVCDRDGVMIATAKRVDDTLVTLETMPVEISRVPNGMSDVRFVAAGALSRMSNAINTFYREIVPFDTVRTSNINNGMAVVEQRLTDFLQMHVVKNPDLQELVRQNIAAKYPDGNAPGADDGMGGPS